MTPARRIFVVCLFGLLLEAGAQGTARASGLRTLAGGWLLDGSDTARFLTWTAGSDTVARNRDPQGFGVWAAAGQARLFGMPELPVTSLTLGAVAPSGTWQLGVQWERTGGDFLVEDDFTVAFRVGISPRLGIRYRLNRWAVASYPAASHGEPALEVGWTGSGVLGRWDLTVLWHPSDPPPWHGQRGRRPLALVKVVDLGLALAVGIDLAADGTPHVGFQGLARLTGGLAAGIRADPSTGSLGPTLAWQGAGLLFRTCHTVHPNLGVTHRFHLGFGDSRGALW